jgi:hypothetical protein
MQHCINRWMPVTYNIFRTKHLNVTHQSVTLHGWYVTPSLTLHSLDLLYKPPLAKTPPWGSSLPLPLHHQQSQLSMSPTCPVPLVPMWRRCMKPGPMTPGVSMPPGMLTSVVIPTKLLPPWVPAPDPMRSPWPAYCQVCQAWLLLLGRLTATW